MKRGTSMWPGTWYELQLVVIVVESAQIGKTASVLFVSNRPGSEKYSTEKDERMSLLLKIAEHSLMGWTKERHKCILRMHSHVQLNF